MQMKYVRHRRLGFVLWPDMNGLFHAHVGSLLDQIDRDGIVSAGLVIIYRGTVSCSGRSESLDIDSMSGDSAALANQLGLKPAEGAR